MTWTKILTAKEKKHLREYVVPLSGLRIKWIALEHLRACACPECKRILNKIEGSEVK